MYEKDPHWLAILFHHGRFSYACTKFKKNIYLKSKEKSRNNAKEHVSSKEIECNIVIAEYSINATYLLLLPHRTYYTPYNHRPISLKAKSHEKNILRNMFIVYKIYLIKPRDNSL